MATSGSFQTSAYTASSGSQFRLILNWTARPYNIQNNTTTIDWSIVGSTTSNGGYVYAQNITLKFDNVIAYQHNLETDDQFELRDGKTLVSGTYTFDHAANGTKTFNAYLEAGIWHWEPYYSGSGSYTLPTIPRKATFTSCPSEFYDDDGFTFKYSNLAGENVDYLRACITIDGSKADVEYKPIPHTGDTFKFTLTDAEKNVLRSATTSGNERQVIVRIRTMIGDMNECDDRYITFKIKSPKPKIGEPTYYDENDKTYDLTGDRSKIVRYCSNVRVTSNISAVTGSTITNQTVTCGSATLSGTTSLSGTINGPTSDTFVFTAKDSRGNSETFTKTCSNFVNYVRLTCNLGNNMPDVAGNMTVKVTGKYFNGYFGKVNNALNVYYRYKVAGGSWKSDPILITNVTYNSDGTYTATANITGLDYQQVYVFQAYAKDVLTVTAEVEKNVKGAPVFDWGQHDFKFNVPAYDENGLRIGPTEIVRLWTNSNVTSTFAAQTVSLALSDYEFVIIDMGSSNESSIPYGEGHIIRKNNRRNIMGFITYLCSRPVTVSNTGIKFEDAKVFKTYGTATSDNSYLVPLVIYGVRGVT